MPVFDWTRSSLDYLGEDKSTSLAYFKDEIENVNPSNLSLPDGMNIVRMIFFP